jgi:primosomal replication protein N
MSLFPRLRQACPGSRWGTAAAQAGQGSDALARHSPLAEVASALQGQDSRLALNRLFLSGVLAADPQKEKGRDGDPVILLLVAFPAPDAKDTQERVETASCEVEVPARVAEKHGQELRPGESIFITGQLSGGGGVIATELHSGPPPG